MVDDNLVGVAPGSAPSIYRRPATAAYSAAGRRPGHDMWTAVWFLLPGFTGLLAFLILPLVASLSLSFTNWQIMGQTKFIGIRNYVFALGTDPVFWQVVGNTIVYSVEYLVLNIVVSLMMAVAIINLKFGRQLFRLVFFLPTFVPLVGSSVVWVLIFTPGGFLDWLLASLGIPLPNLITDTRFAMQAVVVVSLWSGFGYNLLLFGAALESIPQQYIDAAAIDGATS